MVYYFKIIYSYYFLFTDVLFELDVPDAAGLLLKCDKRANILKVFFGEFLVLEEESDSLPWRGRLLKTPEFSKRSSFLRICSSRSCCIST